MVIPVTCSSELLLQTQFNGYELDQTVEATATGLSEDSDKQCLKDYYITSLMLHFNDC